ncbi:MAG: hypothetical protein AAF628_10255 [Planctomycetota bacterium]
MTRREELLGFLTEQEQQEYCAQVEAVLEKHVPWHAQGRAWLSAMSKHIEQPERWARRWGRLARQHPDWRNSPGSSTIQLDDQISGGRDPASLYEEQEDAQAVLDRIDALPPSLRQVASLLLEDRDYRAMAQELGISYEALKKRVYRLRTALRRAG